MRVTRGLVVNINWSNIFDMFVLIVIEKMLHETNFQLNNQMNFFGLEITFKTFTTSASKIKLISHCVYVQTHTKIAFNRKIIDSKHFNDINFLDLGLAWPSVLALHIETKVLIISL